MKFTLCCLLMLLMFGIEARGETNPRKGLNSEQQAKMIEVYQGILEEQRQRHEVSVHTLELKKTLTDLKGFYPGDESEPNDLGKAISNQAEVKIKLKILKKSIDGRTEEIAAKTSDADDSNIVLIKKLQGISKEIENLTSGNKSIKNKELIGLLSKVRFTKKPFIAHQDSIIVNKIISMRDVKQ